LRYCLYIDGVNNLKARGITTFAYSPIFIGGSGTHPAGTMSQNISIDGMIVAGPSDWSGSGTDPIIRINKVGTVNINDMRTIANLPATRSGIVVDITGGGVAEDVNIRNALIIGGNIAYKYVGASFSSLTDSTADLQSVGAVFLSGATQIKVSDNVITDSAVYNGTTPCNYQYGITATSGSHEIMISNNIVTGGYYGLQCGDAITMDGTTGEVSVISNDIWAASRAGQARGIVITDGSQGPVVVGNNFRDSVISPVTGITTATPAVVSCDNVAGGIFDLKYRIGSIVTFDGGTGDWSRLSGTKWTVTAATTTNFTINSLGATGFTGSPPTRVFHAGVGIQDFTSGEILGDPHGRTIYANRIPQSATLPLAHGMINGFSGQFPGGYTAAWGHYEVAKVAVGYGSAASSCTAPGGCWKVTDPRGAITYSNIVGSDQQVVVASLPAGTFVEAARIQTTTAFANVTTAQAQLGLNTDFDFFISAPYDLKAAVSATNFSPQDGKLVNYGGTHNLPIGTNLVLRIAATGGNLDVLNNGASVAVWVKWAVLR
jgi:hypothetical protein